MSNLSTPKAKVILIGENHIRVEILDHEELELSDIIEINIAKINLVGNKRHTVLVVPGSFTTISNEARIFSASKEINRNAIAKAFIVLNTTHRLIGNFFIKVNRPHSPTRLFSSEVAAIKWLTEMSEKDEK